MGNCHRTMLEEHYLIMPQNIDTSKHFWSAFGNSETETSARWLVMFAQERNQGWVSFTKEEIVDFYQKTMGPSKKFWFNQLFSSDNKGWIIQTDDDICHFTQGFVDRCYESSPQKP